MKKVKKVKEELVEKVKRVARVYNIDSEKRPTGQYKHFGDFVGIEIECFFPYSEFPQGEDYGAFNALKRTLMRARIPDLTLGTDGSIRPPSGYFGVEIKILCKRNDMSNLKLLCQFFKTYGADVNSSCGLHVHFDSRGMQDSYKQRISANFERSLPYLTKMVPKSRTRSTYCYPRVSKDKFSAFHMDTAYQTVEVRLHSGTLNFTKISNWISIIMSIARSKELTYTSPKDLNEFVSAAKLDDTLKEYYISRSNEFNEDWVKEQGVVVTSPRRTKKLKEERSA